MFACIFFLEDTSLCVVESEDPKLEILGDFKPHENVRMKWGKQTYNGTIIKVAECQSYLQKFATQAYSAVLKAKTRADCNTVPEELYTYELIQNESSSSGKKRERVLTEKVKESRAQERQLSPKKKKKSNQGIQKKQTDINDSGKAVRTPALKQREINNSKESTALETGKLMFSLFSQFEDGKTGASLSNKSNVNEADDNKTDDNVVDIDALNTVNNPCNQMALNNNTKTTLTMNCQISGNQLASTQMAPSRMTDTVPVSSGFNTTEASPGTSLSASVNVFKDAMTVLTEDQMKSVPPADSMNYFQADPPLSSFIATLKSISNLEFSRFLRNFLDHIENDGTCSHPCIQNLTLQQAYSQQQTSFLSDLETAGTDSSFVNDSHFESFHSYDPNTYLASTPVRPAEPHRNTTMKNVVTQSSESCQVAVGSPQSQPLPRTTSSNVNKLDQPLRRSPRKHKRNKEVDMVRLVKDSDVMVDRNSKRKAASAAMNKPGREGYFLTYRLAGEIFSPREMFESRGLGIGKSKLGEDRPVLDPTKVKVLKDFVTAWCKEHHFKLPTDSTLNFAITERIGYARKQFIKLESQNNE